MDVWKSRQDKLQLLLLVVWSNFTKKIYESMELYCTLKVLEKLNKNFTDIPLWYFVVPDGRFSLLVVP